MRLSIDVATKKIKILDIGNTIVDNTLLREVYSRLVDLWKSDLNFAIYHFPMTYITINHITSTEYFSFINGWSLKE